MAVTILTAHWRQWQGWMIVTMLGALLATTGLAGNFNHDGDYNGDGVMDPAVYDEPTGEWHVLFSGSNFNKPQSFTWGGPGWKAIQSDYDGDGRADIVLYNQETGKWIILLSCADYQDSVCFTFGATGWVALTGDYDGDGITDPTVYCKDIGMLIIKLSRSGYTPIMINIGGPGYIAVSGDYDGDGFSDPATYRESDGQWLIYLSSLSYTPASCYVSTKGDGPLVPSPADYDGDRKTDPAVFAYSAPSFEDLGKRYVFAWHLLYSSRNYNQTESFYFLGREDGEPSNADPAPGDYDGDGKADFAVSWPDPESAHVMWKNWWSSHFDGSYFIVIQWAGTDVHPVQR